MEKIMEELGIDTMLDFAIRLGWKVAKIILILFACWFLAKIAQKLASRFYENRMEKSHLAMSERKASTLNSITSSVLKYVIYFVGIFAVLTQLGVDSASLLVVASAGSVAIGLGAQSVITDMIEGFFILFEDHYAIGDVVTIQNITGVVEGVTMRSTKIRDPQGRIHIVPNGSVGTVTNLCNDFINAVVTVGVAYGENIDRVLAVLCDEMEKAMDIEDIIELPKVMGVVGLDDSAVTIKIVGKCKIKTNVAVEAELRRRIKNRFDQEKIEIPFPQRTVHLVHQKEA